MSEVKEVCRAFRNNGSCRYGEECKYGHTTGEPIPYPEPGPCFNFREAGECKFGNRCRFKHGENDDRASQRRERKERAPREPREPRVPRVEKQGEGGDEKTRKRNPRKYFPRRTAAPTAEGAAPTEAGAGVAPRRRRHRPVRPAGDSPPVKIDEVCNNYMSGKCRYGSACRRQHPGNVPQAPVQKIAEACNNFKEGRCRFGDLCRRQH